MPTTTEMPTTATGTAQYFFVKCKKPSEFSIIGSATGFLEVTSVDLSSSPMKKVSIRSLALLLWPASSKSSVASFASSKLKYKIISRYPLTRKYKIKLKTEHSNYSLSDLKTKTHTLYTREFGLEKKGWSFGSTCSCTRSTSPLSFNALNSSFLGRLRFWLRHHSSLIKQGMHDDSFLIGMSLEFEIRVFRLGHQARNGRHVISYRDVVKSLGMVASGPKNGLRLRLANGG
ncbi:Cytochrome b5 isoform A [Senna tora]|uniref:Cytochrome b5 isoform A n=1 Tax=Senna tora TaxID=362788 RepID=A0A834XCL0_9FABA|nr:Cytochrome b5 isoform A [Senna tora]